MIADGMIDVGCWSQNREYNRLAIRLVASIIDRDTCGEITSRGVYMRCRSRKILLRVTHKSNVCRVPKLEDEGIQSEIV